MGSVTAIDIVDLGTDSTSSSIVATIEEIIKSEIPDINTEIVGDTVTFKRANPLWRTKLMSHSGVVKSKIKEGQAKILVDASVNPNLLSCTLIVFIGISSVILSPIVAVMLVFYYFKAKKNIENLKSRIAYEIEAF